ncbi:unnamed protein product, partial [Rotaria magnacalcarata]
LIANRVKVVKGPKLQGQHRPTHDELDMNATYISMNDLSCLSNCKLCTLIEYMLIKRNL